MMIKVEIQEIRTVLEQDKRKTGDMKRATGISGPSSMTTNPPHQQLGPLIRRSLWGMMVGY
jgi:hypothetical protein